MQFYELIIKVPVEYEETSLAILSLLDISGIYTEDYSDLTECPLVKNFALIDEELLKKDISNVLIHIYFGLHVNINDIREYISYRFDIEKIPYTIISQKINEDDYANSWKQYYKPLKIGKITIVPQWEKYESKENEKLLWIDPGVAFGTGTHETTHLCIEKLQQFDLENSTLLDIGCGSGILSIVSLISGARLVNAVDIDPNAVKVSKSNVDLNEFNGEFNAYSGNILDDKELKEIKDIKYDIVVANIVADVIIRIIPLVKTLLNDNGHFLMSGIITERKDEVIDALRKNGMIVSDVSEMNGWVLISTQ